MNQQRKSFFKINAVISAVRISHRETESLYDEINGEAERFCHGLAKPFGNGYSLGAGKGNRLNGQKYFLKPSQNHGG